MGARQRQHPISFPKRSEFCRWWAFLRELSSEVATFDQLRISDADRSVGSAFGAIRKDRLTLFVVAETWCDAARTRHEFPGQNHERHWAL